MAKPGKAQRTKERLKWRDNLLSKYEARIRELETELRYILPWIQHPDPSLKRSVRDILEKKV